MEPNAPLVIFFGIDKRWLVYINVLYLLVHIVEYSSDDIELFSLKSEGIGFWEMTCVVILVMIYLFIFPIKLCEFDH